LTKHTYRIFSFIAGRSLEEFALGTTGLRRSEMVHQFQLAHHFWHITVYWYFLGLALLFELLQLQKTYPTWDGITNVYWKSSGFGLAQSLLKLFQNQQIHV